MAVEPEVQEFFDEYWAPKFFPEGEGGLGLEEFIDLVKNELYDYGKLRWKLAGFFDDVTGGRASKPNTDLDVIARLVDERVGAAYDDGNEQGYRDGYHDGQAEPDLD